MRVTVETGLMLTHMEGLRAQSRAKTESKRVRVAKIHVVTNPKTQGITMSNPTPEREAHEIDAVESVVSSMPLVLPLVGGVLMFLLAFIAVSMA